MATRRKITVIDRGDLIVVRGWQIKPALDDGGIKAVFSGSVSGWMVDHHRLADLVALLESRNFPVVVIDETDGGDAA